MALVISWRALRARSIECNANAFGIGHGGGSIGRQQFHSISSSSANVRAATASSIFRDVRCAMRLPIWLLGTVWRLSKFAAQVFGKPSASVSTTSVGMLRIVEVIGAMVTEFRMPIAESRVSISTGRFLLGVLKEYQHTSPRLTPRPNPAHPPRCRTHQELSACRHSLRRAELLFHG